jgi:hypothetical protein
MEEGTVGTIQTVRAALMMTHAIDVAIAPLHSFSVNIAS